MFRPKFVKRFVAGPFCTQVKVGNEFVNAHSSCSSGSGTKSTMYDPVARQYVVQLCALHRQYSLFYKRPPAVIVLAPSVVHVIAGEQATIEVTANLTDYDSSSTVEFSWTVTSTDGASVPLCPGSFASNATVLLCTTMPGVYLFNVTVVDSDGASGASSATVVLNTIPVAALRTVLLDGNRVLLQGSLTFDVDSPLSDLRFRFSYYYEAGVVEVEPNEDLFIPIGPTSVEDHLPDIRPSQNPGDYTTEFPALGTHWFLLQVTDPNGAVSSVKEKAVCSLVVFAGRDVVVPIDAVLSTAPDPIELPGFAVWTEGHVCCGR